MSSDIITFIGVLIPIIVPSAFYILAFVVFKPRLISFAKIIINCVMDYATI